MIYNKLDFLLLLRKNENGNENDWSNFPFEKPFLVLFVRVVLNRILHVIKFDVF